MKVKTSVTLTPELLAAVDDAIAAGESRSEFLERVAWDYLRARARRERDARETAILNAMADVYNAEAEDVLLDTEDFAGERDDAAR